MIMMEIISKIKINHVINGTFWDWFKRPLGIIFLIILLQWLLGCAPTLKHSPGIFHIGMTLDNFKAQNDELLLEQAVADTVIYYRIELYPVNGLSRMMYKFVDGELFGVKRVKLVDSGINNKMIIKD